MRIELERIHPVVKPTAEALNKLKAVVKDDNLEHPLVLMEVTKLDWIQSKQMLPFILDPPEVKGKFYACMTGNTRLQLLKDRGYTEAECVVVDTYDDAVKLMMEQGKWFRQKYGSLD